jgi:hypothetical protein
LFLTYGLRQGWFVFFFFFLSFQAEFALSYSFRIDFKLYQRSLLI